MQDTARSDDRHPEQLGRSEVLIPRLLQGPDLEPGRQRVLWFKALGTRSATRRPMIPGGSVRCQNGVRNKVWTHSNAPWWVQTCLDARSPMDRPNSDLSSPQSTARLAQNRFPVMHPGAVPGLPLPTPPRWACGAHARRLRLHVLRPVAHTRSGRSGPSARCWHA